jgi:outer membrane protein assembly factor BamB
MGRINKAFTVFFILTVTILGASFFTLESGYTQQASGDWPMYQADPSHSGVGSGNPVLSPQVLWKTNIDVPSDLEYGSFSWSAPTIVNSVVYAGSSFYASIGYDSVSWGDVFAFKASDGSVIWDYRDNSTDKIGTPIVQNGVVFFSASNYAGALDSSNGASLWNNTANGGTSPIVINGVFYDNNGHVVYALNATNGEQIWINQIPGLSPPAYSNGVLYTCSLDNNVYAVNATDGTKLWNYTTGDFVESSPAISEGIVYVGSNDGHIYALNATSGAKIWSYRTGGYDISSPAVYNGEVYVGSGNGNVYSLNATTGVNIWSYYTGYPVTASPAIVQGVVYVASNSLDVYAFNASTGYAIWRYPAGEFVSFFAAADGLVCAGGAESGGIIAFGALPQSNLSLIITGISIIIVAASAIILLVFIKKYRQKRKKVTEGEFAVAVLPPKPPTRWCGGCRGGACLRILAAYRRSAISR